MTTDKIISLAGSCDIAVIDQGPTDGTPVLYLHGTPGSNKDRIGHEAFYDKEGIRLVSVNRPGIGGSSYAADWGALSFADDLKQVLDKLAIEKATVIGFSSGGLYACALAQRHPRSVGRLGLLSSIGPFDIPSLGSCRSEVIRQFHDAARENPAILLEQLSTVTTAEAVNAKMLSLVAPVDQEVMSRPDVAKQLLLAYSDVLSQGMEPLIAETALNASPWGFAAADIQVDTRIWHGTADINVPIECSKYLAAQIPHSEAIYIEGAGHYFSFAHWPELLKAITGD